MMFASKKPRDLNHEPLPFSLPGEGGGRLASWEAELLTELGPLFDPRPEFDHVQHNEPNPILVAVRERVDLIDAYMGSVVSGDGTLPHLTIDPRHYDHARRVLTRLADLNESTAVSR